jgi:iron(III) transport system permease protein
MSRPFSILVLAVTGLYFTLFFVWPSAETLRGAFVTNDGSLTLAYLLEVFRNPIYLEGLSNAFLLAVASTALAIVLALPLAFLSDRFTFPGKSILSGLVLVPMILPPFVGAIGVKQILGQAGALNSLCRRSA